ncbi:MULTISPECIES: thiamine pyrophosphate-dependent enzyme [Aminobacterium]|uniref:thiamine pyrophosphate-dependent enzyme n=1 Tax=Aminobacterium TaxID=81466 RepID=UPI001BCBE3C9|nr:thiamine pyrophosphate-dependent enzyme [Aminobacterium sp. UBA4987]
MNSTIFDLPSADMSWCPGCGDFLILDALKIAFTRLGWKPADVVIVTGIGQAAKTPHFMKCHFFNGLHGRALSNATGIKAANPLLNVVAIGGDGDMYGEGGNHFIHTIRRNPDITNIVYDNMVYGLTKGQASPTSFLGFKTPVQVHGVTSVPFNPLAVAIVLGATFVARAFAGDVEETAFLIEQAVQHKGYALLDIFQPCVSFNKVNTYNWFKENTYYIGDSHNSADQKAALALALKSDSFPLGVLYRQEGRAAFEENMDAYKGDKAPLFKRMAKIKTIEGCITSMA